MTDEDRRIVNFIRERELLYDATDCEIYNAYRDTLFFARVRLHIAVEDFKSSLWKLFS